MALTARAAGVKKLTVHGPPQVNDLMQLTRHFADCEATEIVPSPILSSTFRDDTFRIKAFSINTDIQSEQTKRPRIDTEAKSISTSYAYYFQTIQPRRKLDKGKCMMYGIPKQVYESPAVRDLLNGEPLVLKDGRTFQSEQLTTPSPFSPNFLILDCQSEACVDDWLSCSELFDSLINESDEADSTVKTGLSFVVHFVPNPDFFHTDVYQRLVTRLEDVAKKASDSRSVDSIDEAPTHLPPLQHLLMDGSSQLPSLTGLYSQSAVLNHFFDTNIYPLPHALRSEVRRKNISQAIDSLPSPNSIVARAEPQLEYHIRPWKGFVKPSIESLELTNLVESTFDPLYMSREEAQTHFDTMAAKLNEAGCDYFPANSTSQTPVSDTVYPKITFLGTGSSCPNKYRNISGILLELNPDSCLLLDCGEGTLSQLYTLFGPDQASDVLKRLKLVLITHMHADHHGGLFSIALQRSRLLQQLKADDPVSCQLTVLAPPRFERWMSSFNVLFADQCPLNLYPVTSVYDRPTASTGGDGVPLAIGPWTVKQISQPVKTFNAVLKKLKVEVTPVQVPHTGTSWAFIVRAPHYTPTSGGDDSNSPSSFKWSLVYSGDTTPCQGLIDAGNQCDLLIHEATLEDVHRDLAVRARHSTVSEAIEVSQSMQAKFTILNHFSQRYGRLPPHDTYTPNVAVSFDLMQVTFSDLTRLPFYVPYYKYAFAKHWDLVQEKSNLAYWRKARESNVSLDSATPGNHPTSNNKMIKASSTGTR